MQIRDRPAAVSPYIFLQYVTGESWEGAEKGISQNTCLCFRSTMLSRNGAVNISYSRGYADVGLTLRMMNLSTSQTLKKWIIIFRHIPNKIIINN